MPTAWKNLSNMAKKFLFCQKVIFWGEKLNRKTFSAFPRQFLSSEDGTF